MVVTSKCAASEITDALSYLRSSWVAEKIHATIILFPIMFCNIHQLNAIILILAHFLGYTRDTYGYASL